MKNKLNKVFVNQHRQKSLIFGLFVFIATFIGVGYVRALLNPPIYQANGKILSPYVNPNSSEITTNLSNDLALIKSNFLAEKVLKELNYNLTKDDLESNLKVNQLAQGQILELSFHSENPRQAALVVNTWMEKYLESKQENQAQSNQSLTKFLDQELPKSEAKLSQAEIKLKKFQEENNILDANAEANSVLKNIGDLELKITSLQAQLKTLNSREIALQNLIQVDPQKASVASVISDSTTAESLLQQLQEVQIKLRQAKTIYSERHPEIINLRQKEEIIKTQLQNYLQQNSPQIQGSNISQNDLETIYKLGKTQQKLLAEYTSIEQKITNLQQELNLTQNLIDNYKTRFTELRELELEQKKLEQEIETQEKLVQNLKANYQEAQLTQNQAQENSLSLELAKVPEKPINFSFLEYIIQGLIAGLILSLVSTIILQKFLNRPSNNSNFS